MGFPLQKPMGWEGSRPLAGGPIPKNHVRDYNQRRDKCKSRADFTIKKDEE
jgi:hypothetical protein